MQFERELSGARLLDAARSRWYHRIVDVSVAEVVGRDEELDAGRAAIERATSAVVLVRGAAGIGKTTVWGALMSSLAASGRRLLVARPVEAESRLSFTVVSDVLHPFLDEVLPALPAPQRRAVEAALLLRDVESSVVDPRTLGAALLRSLGIVGRDSGVVLAIDDLQWVDAPSRGAIQFALRRLSTVGASALFALRGEVAVLPADPRTEVVTLDLGPLSLGALQRVVTDRFGEALPRRVLRRVQAISGGNPFYALEIVRALRELGPVQVGDELPVPSDLDRLLQERIATLPPAARRAMAAAAALADPRVGVIEQEGDLQPALDDRLVRVERGTVRFNHPLLALAAYRGLAPRRQRELHLHLAELVDDPEQRARHLALGHPKPDESVASELEAAAESALARGAPVAAAELLELALERTVDADRGIARRAAAAQAYWRAGELASARSLAEQAAAALPAGPDRAQMLVLLSFLAGTEDLPTACALAEQAWREAKGDVAVEARAAARLAFTSGFAGNAPRALEFAKRALERSDSLPDTSVAAVVADAAFMQLAAEGRVDWELLKRGLAAEERAGGRSEFREPRQTLAIALLFQERYAEARTTLEQCIESVEAFGYDLRVVDLLNILSEVETRSGRPAVGAAVATRAGDMREQLGLDSGRFNRSGDYFRAIAAAYLGEVEKARTLAQASLAAAESSGDFAFGVQATAVLGFLELSLGNDEAAVEILAPTAQRLAAAAPGMHPMHVPVLPNLIQALIGLGRLDEARAHVERLEERGRELDSGWALAQAFSAHGMLAAADGERVQALMWFDRAMAEHDRTGPFERGRTLLARGMVLRRARQWRTARESLSAALAIFEEIQVSLWAEQARAELGRIGGRSRTEGLTPTEDRIAKLVATGRSNKEIANELFVTVRTVETHLTRVYGKLGVRSRTELASRPSE